MIEARVVDVLAQEEEAQEEVVVMIKKEGERKRERGGDYIAKREGSWRGSDSLCDVPKLKLRMSLGWSVGAEVRKCTRREKDEFRMCTEKRYQQNAPRIRQRLH